MALKVSINGKVRDMTPEEEAVHSDQQQALRSEAAAVRDTKSPERRLLDALIRKGVIDKADLDT